MEPDLFGAADTAQAIEPARAGLDPIPLPRVTDFEPAVQEHLRQATDALATVVSRGGGGGALGGANGALARILHAYELFESAEPAYRNAVRLASGDATWRYLLGYLYQQTGRLQEAADQYEAAIRLQPDWRTTAVRLGEVYLQLNRLSDAREQFQSAVTTFPSVARNGLGEIALRDNRYSEAIEHFRAVLERVPTATSVHYSLAMAYRGAGRADDARAELERRGPGTVRMADPTVDSLQSLVRGERLLVIHVKRLYDAGQFEGAAEAFRRALDASPDSAAARGNLGLALSQLGRLDEAVPHLQRAFADAPDDTAIRSTLVRGLLRLSRYEEAIAVLRRVASLDPDHEESVVSLAILLSNRGRFGEALLILEQADQRHPIGMSIATTLARLLASSPDRSLRDGTRALGLAMRVYETSRTAADAETVALALAELQRCGEAREWMERAIALAEGSEENARLKAELRNYPADACRR
jgi:tetratricopeptide (TPR) repeat protein